VADGDKIADFKAALEELPEDRKGRLYEWFHVQTAICESLAITPEKWFEYVRWAIENPHDYTSLRPWMDGTSTSDSDVLDADTNSSAARRQLGDETSRRPVQKGKPIEERAQGSELDRAVLQQLLRTQRKG
jgi:hypothetical protein